MLSNYFNPS